MRSSWKSAFLNLSLVLWLRRSAADERRHRPIYLSSRRWSIHPSLFSRFVQVPNGRQWVEVGIKPTMVGHVLGEFAPNRVPVIHFRKKRQQTRSKNLKTEKKPSPPKRVVDVNAGKTPQKKKDKKLSKMRYSILSTPKLNRSHRNPLDKGGHNG